MTDQHVLTDVPPRPVGLIGALRRAARASGRSMPGIVGDWLRLRRRGRRLLLNEYLDFGLYRPGTDPENFVGVIEGAILALAVNFRKNRRVLVHDKLLFDAMLRGLGYPVPELQALISRHERAGDFASLQTPEQIAAFLRGAARYPLFLKPARGQNSRGAVAIDRRDGDDLILKDGTRQDIASFVGGLRKSHGGAVLIQTHITQHETVRRIVGHTVATVRVITFLEDDRPDVLRAFWKVPVGGAVADNLCRGNLIGTVDVASGRLGPVRSHAGFEAVQVLTHPGTGAPLVDVVLPDWPEVLRLARQCAVLMRGMPLVGWDIALGPDGPLVVEANSVPSVELTQYPDQRGFLTGDLLNRFERELARLKTTEIRDARAQRRRVRDLLAKRILQGFG